MSPDVRPPRDRAALVKRRLLNRWDRRQETFEHPLIRYVLEWFPYRIGQPPTPRSSFSKEPFCSRYGAVRSTDPPAISILRLKPSGITERYGNPYLIDR